MMTGSDLRKWREKHLHSQASLAKALDFSVKQIIRWEMSQSEIPRVVEMVLKGIQVQPRKPEEAGRWPEK